MSYTPNNIYVYMAAFSGALAGMGVQGRQPRDTVAADYSGQMLLAGAWAQALDTVWGPSADALNIEEAESLSIAFWSERQPLPLTPYTTASTWLSEAGAISAMMAQSKIYFASQGSAPAPVPNTEKVFDIRLFGANPSGTPAANSAAIQRAVAAKDANGGGVVYFPPFTFLHAGFDTGVAPAIFRGDGWGSSTFVPYGSGTLYTNTTGGSNLVYVGAGAAITVGKGNHFFSAYSVFEDIALTNAYSAGSIGFDLSAAQAGFVPLAIYFSHVLIAGFDTGLKTGGAESCVVNYLDVRACNTAGIYAQDDVSAGGGPTNWYFTWTSVQQCNNGIVFGNAQGFEFEGGIIQSNVNGTLFHTANFGPPWTTGLPVVAGQIIVPTVGNGFYFVAGGPGVTGAIQPVWPSVGGGTVNDNGIIWTAFAQNGPTGITLEKFWIEANSGYDAKYDGTYNALSIQAIAWRDCVCNSIVNAIQFANGGAPTNTAILFYQNYKCNAANVTVPSWVTRGSFRDCLFGTLTDNGNNTVESTDGFSRGSQTAAFPAGIFAAAHASGAIQVGQGVTPLLTYRNHAGSPDTSTITALSRDGIDELFVGDATTPNIVIETATLGPALLIGPGYSGVLANAPFCIGDGVSGDIANERQAFFTAVATIVLSAGSQTPPATTLRYILIPITGNATTANTIVLPNAPGWWEFDLSGATGVGSVVFTSGSASTPVLTIAALSKTLWRVVTRGGNTIALG